MAPPHSAELLWKVVPVMVSGHASAEAPPPTTPDELPRMVLSTIVIEAGKPASPP